jgi:hypothetical protein
MTTLYAVLTKQQARYLADTIAKSGTKASNNPLSATSTRITTIAREFENDKKNVLVGIYSHYVADVKDELPKKYQNFDWNEIDDRELDVYLHNH